MSDTKATTQTIDIDAISQRLLKAVADIEGPVSGAFNLRREGR